MKLAVTIFAFILVVDGSLGLANFDFFRQKLTKKVKPSYFRWLLVLELASGVGILLWKYFNNSLA